MLRARFRVIAVLVAAAAATGYGYQSSPANRQWPPDVQKVSDESPVMPPAEALKTFYMPPGYHLELVASEPLIRDPVAIDFDPDGRLWAVEMPGFVRDLNVPEPNLDRIGRIVVLEDTNGDGTMDKRTVFADGLELARALKVLDHGVLVGEPPNVWLMHDTNGDLKMDTKEKVTDTYGRREGRVEQNANGFHWSLDNTMYTANGDVLLRWKSGKIEVQKTLSRGEWGATHDDAGRVYRNTNSSALHVDFVSTTYFARNPTLQRTRGSYESIGDSSVNKVWPIRPNPGTNRAYQFGIDKPDGTLADFTSVCAPEIYRGDRLPAELYGNAFVAEPAANLVSRLIIKDTGTTLLASKAYERGEFIASTDERFRPVFLSTAPDGTLYIVDMYRGVVQQRADITEYLRDHIVKHKLEQGIELGRVYRVVHETTRRDTPPALTKATSAQLVETLSHPNGWRRDTAQRLLVERADKAAIPALKRLAETAKEPRTRLHALWTLDGMDAIDATLVTKALDDTSRDVRASAVRLSERWLGEKTHAIQTAILKRIDDPDWSVRQQLAASLGALVPGKRETALASLLTKHGADPIVMDAALSGVRGGETALLEKLLQGGGAPPASASQTLAPEPQREAAIVMVASLIVRGAQGEPIQTLFSWIADESRPSWQRSALLRGAEVALNVAGAQVPGTAGRRGGAGAGAGANPPAAATPAPANAVATPVAPPCPTCPGGRAGPGGAYAFAQVPQTGGGGGGGRGGRGGAGLRLTTEPVKLSALATKGGEFGPRATALLARIEWPGKPGASAPITPLTPAEQQRFNAGSEVYKNICISCHQPDGRGQDKIAPSLIGSALALAPAEVTARILLNGKEGPIGLMPPVGTTLTDDQIAGVLTYVRREWGQDGTPVDAATVKAVRALTAGRARPWTNDELMKLIPAGRGGG